MSKTQKIWIWLIIVGLMIICALAWAENPLPVQFIPQSPPGGWSGNMNCGPACLAMAAAHVKGTTPTSADILAINNFLGLDEKGWRGGEKTGTNCNDLINASSGACELQGIHKVYQGLDDLKKEIDRGCSVIVAVVAGCLSNRGYRYAGQHFVLAIGYTDTQIICNDPGTSQGASKHYVNGEFIRAMKGQNNAMIVGFEKPTSTPQSGFRVIETYPADGATNIPIDIDMWFRFSDDVDTHSFIVPEHFDDVFSGSSPRVNVNWLNIIVEPAPTIRSYGGPVLAQYDPKDPATAAWLMISWDPNTSYTIRLTA